MNKSIKNIRNIAIIGPYSSGKTTLLESLLFVTDKIKRKGSIAQHNTVGDSSQEARDRSMSVEVSVAGQSNLLQFVNSHSGCDQLPVSVKPLFLASAQIEIH